MNWEQMIDIVNASVVQSRLLQFKSARPNAIYRYDGVKMMRTAFSGQSIRHTPQCQHSSG